MRYPVDLPGPTAPDAPAAHAPAAHAPAAGNAPTALGDAARPTAPGPRAVPAPLTRAIDAVRRRIPDEWTRPVTPPPRLRGVERPIAPLDPAAIHRHFARRAGRIAFGGVLIAGMVALVGLSAAPRAVERVIGARHSAAAILGASWLAAAVAGAIAYGVARRLRWSPRPEAMLTASVQLPTAGIALLLPLTLHLLVALVIALPDPSRWVLSGFDEWVQLSLCVTGPAHLAFTALCLWRAWALICGEPAPMTPWRIWRITALVSCVPSVLLFGIPPLVVALTGLPIVPLLSAMRPAIERERAELRAIPERLPRAIAVARREL